VRSSPPSADPPTLPVSIDLKPQSAVVVTRQLDGRSQPSIVAVSVSVEDRLAINELIALHGHIMDSGELERPG
jgi:hypothetical protein